MLRQENPSRKFMQSYMRYKFTDRYAIDLPNVVITLLSADPGGKMMIDVDPVSTY